MSAKRPSDRRSTSNGNSAGSSYTRRARRAWMWRTFSRNGWIKCHHCPRHMRKREFQVDRWPICGHAGGRYVRENVVPACVKCNGGRCVRCMKVQARISISIEATPTQPAEVLVIDQPVVMEISHGD